MVTPVARRQAASHVVAKLDLSERRACRLVGVSRSVYRYRSCRPDDSPLRNRLKALAEQYPRYGYPTLHDLLKAEGLVKNRKRTYRLYREEGLQVRTKRCKKLKRPRIPMLVPNKTNERWSIDFVSDQLANGRRFRIFNIVDDYSRECVGQIVDTSISGVRVTRYLNELAVSRGLPKVIVCDNGPEFTSKAMFFWAREARVTLHFIQPGKPTQNAFVESFNGKFRDQCLNLHWLRDLAEAKQIIKTWRTHYNEVRPHRSLGGKPPAVFARQAA
jgi:putative transposase